MRHTAIWLMWLVGMALLGTPFVLPPSLPPTSCATRENKILGRLETECADGTRALSYWNEALRRWETSITPGPSQAVPGHQAPWKREHR